MNRLLAFDTWDQLLHQYVDDQGKVDYSTWQIESTQTLKDWLTQISVLDLKDDSNPNQQLALWLNLYNALVINEVLAMYPIDSIRPIFLGIPNWIAFLRFFQRKIHQIGNQEYSLNDIEHSILRPQFHDPRIHFALVCAATGCPLLRNEAYQPELVQAQLEEDAQRFINNSTKVRYESPTLFCSKIFQWYGNDFRNAAGSVPEYIQPYLSIPSDLSAKTPIRYLDYDWSLNQRTSS